MSLLSALNDIRNRAATGQELKFSTDDSLIQLQVTPLDEELYMARTATPLLVQLPTITPTWKN